MKFFSADLKLCDRIWSASSRSIGAATDELRDYVLRSDKKNIAKHRHYSTYYTPDLAELVSIRDRQVIERFDYVFEKASSDENGGPKHSIEEFQRDCN